MTRSRCDFSHMVKVARSNHDELLFGDIAELSVGWIL
jgi:hypothetical protein